MEVERVGEVELGLEPHGAGEVDVLVVQGHVPWVDGQVAVLRISRRISGGEVVPLDRLRHEPVELRGTDLPATAATWASTNAAASTVSAGDVWIVVSATARARHAGTRPDCTWPRAGEAVAQLEGVTDEFFAEVVEIPRTAPSSATQNSATSGQPGPARVPRARTRGR